jgi:xylulokinase
MALLGIDIGTSALKVAAFDETGTVLAQAAASYPVLHPTPGFAEQDARTWWGAVCAALRTLWATVSPADIAAVGVAGQGWSPVLLDKHGDVLAPTPLWLDTRAAAQCDAWRAQGLQDSLFALSGNPLQPGYTTPKVAWMQAHLPDAYAHAAVILQSNGYITYRLTGQCVQDACNAYGWHCYDTRRNRWDQEACRALGISPGLLPPLVPCDEVMGRVTDAAAKETGLLPGTPVVAGGLDAACGALGAGVAVPGQTQEQGGQAGGMSICMGECVADPRLILSRHVLQGQWLLQGGTTGGGGVMRWLSGMLGASPAALDQEAEGIPPGSEGLLFLPYMAGERSPLWDPAAKGVYYGLDFGKTRGHLVRAALEGVAYALRHNLETAREAGAVVGELYAMGGAANSALWTGMKADVTGHPIRVSASDTATTLGAALLAGLGIGIYPDGEAAVRATVRFGRVYTPDAGRAVAYAAGYARYRALSAQLYPPKEEDMA